MSQNQNKQHFLHQQQQHQQQPFLHHHQQHQHQQQWQQQYQHQQQQMHQQQQQQQMAAASAASVAAHHAHVAPTSNNLGMSMNVSAGVGVLPSMNMYAGGGLSGGNIGSCYYNNNSRGASGGGPGINGGFNPNVVGHTNNNVSNGASYAPPIISNYGSNNSSNGNVAAVGRANLTNSNSTMISINGSACAYPQQQAILPPESIKMEPMEHILTPTIQTEELIIKTEPSDDGYNKVSMVDEATHSASYVNYMKHLQNYPASQIKLEDMSQQKTQNFPRRKVQTERSETMPICQRCKMVFFKKHIFSRHVGLSTCDIVEYDFKCSICPMSFMSGEELQEHEQLHRENMFFCHKYCGKYFDTIEICEVHEYMHHDYVNFVCNVCSINFPTREMLFSHMPQHRQQPRFDCSVCRLWFHTPMELHQHRLASPQYCGKFYQRNAQISTQPGSSFRPLPPPHPPSNYNLQDCRMGVVEVPSSNNYSTFLQNRPYPHPNQSQQPPPLHIPQAVPVSTAQMLHTPQAPPLPPLHPLQAMQAVPVPPLRPLQPPQAKPQPPAQPTNSDLTRNNSCDDFQMPQIKTEIKIEHDIFGTSDYESIQSPLPPPPPLPPPQQHAAPTKETNFNDFLNDTFASTQSPHQSINSNNGCSTSDIFSASLQNSSIGSNFSMPTAPVSRTRVVDTGEDNAVCCVPKCGVRKDTSPTLQFFTFPKDEKYLHQWLYNLKMLLDPQADYENYRICSLHFPKRCINRYSLCYWAVPTFNLGHDDVANLYQNREITSTFTLGERAQCSMPGCQSQRGESNCKFYNFPNDMKTLIKWCQNARLPLHSREPRHFCSRHFEDRCFGKFRLKPWAVPTLHLGTSYGKIHDNPGVFNLEEKKCCLPYCRRTRSSDFNLSLYRFPRDEVLLTRWCYNLRLDPSVYRGKNHKICSAHFIKEALGLRKLSPGAVPTLNLGHNDRFNIYENELPTPPPIPPSKMFNYHNNSTPTMSQHTANQDYAQYFSASSLKFSIASITSSVTSNSSTQNNYDTLDVCFVPSCKRTRLNDNVTLHTIPRRDEQMRKWCHNLKIDISKLHKGVRICSAHFESYCIGGCMRPFAVPTLNLGHDDPNIYKNPDVIKKLNIRETCCVQTCKRNRDRDHANLHRFPANQDMLRKWCENLLKPVPDGTKLFNDAICEMHFEDHCLRNKRLEKWAIPTVNLGHDEEPAHKLPTEEEIAEFYAKPAAPNNGDEDGECCVETCRRDPKIDDVKLYRPPEDPEILAKWAYNLQVETPDLMSLRICNLHFESYCIGKRLHSWAIPTLNLSNHVENLYENPAPVQMVKVRREKRGLLPHEPAKPWMPRCCLPHCRKMRHIDNVQLFRFPANRSMSAKWSHNCQLPPVTNGQRRLCSSHFEREVLTKRCPMPQSVPTINLNTPPGYKIYQNPARLRLAKLRLEGVCVISSCRRTRGDGVQLFRFPHSRTLLRKWCNNTKQKPNEAIRAHYRVCSRHFEPHSFGVKRLMPGAVPTLNLDVDVEAIHPNEAQSFAETQCIVNGCESSKELDGAKLFRFPCDDEDMLWKWCNNLKMNPIDCSGVRICNRHFEPECIGTKMLYKWAIPTLELGHSDSEIELVPIPRPEERFSEVKSYAEVKKCCVPNCGKSRKYDEAQMNSFPKSLRLFRIWKHNLKLDFLEFREREKYKICNDHFEPICLGKLRLNYGAIPTINLGHDDVDDLYPVQPEEIQVLLFGKTRPLTERDISRENNDLDSINMSNEIKCCYPRCIATKTLLKETYDLPSQNVLQTLWCTEMKVDTETLSEIPKLCGLHFMQVYKSSLDAATALIDDEDDEDAVAAELKILAEVYENCRKSPIIRGAQCSVTKCHTNQLSSEHKLYPFPLNSNITEKWCFNVGLNLTDIRRYQLKVCALHFEVRCISAAKSLRPWAIPTLRLQRDSAIDLHKNPELGTPERPYELQCCVTGCAHEESDSDEITLHTLPSEPEILDKWLHNLQLEHEQYERYRVCDEHFEKRCYINGHLSRRAIPTLRLGLNNNDIYENEPPAAESLMKDNNNTAVANVKMKKSLDIIKCCVPTCRRSRLQHGVRLFEFPRGHVMLRKWRSNLQLSQTNISTEQLRICCLHFHKRCINGKQLHSWAKPTKLLGHNKIIFDNPKNVPGSFQPKCCVPHCGQQRTMDNNLRTFGFPKDNTVLRKWSANLRMHPDECHGRVCIDHFSAEAIGNRKLRTGAVPTINLGYDEPPPYNNELLGGSFLARVEPNDRELRSERYWQKRSEDEMDDADDGERYDEQLQSVTDVTQIEENDAEANSTVGTDDFYSNYDCNESSFAGEESEQELDINGSKSSIKDDNEEDNSSFNVMCDPLDFVECVGKDDSETEKDVEVVETIPVVDTMKRDSSMRRTRRNTILVDDVDIENSNAETTHLTTNTNLTSTSMSIVSNCKEKMPISVFRHCCLKHCRRKKDQIDSPDGISHVRSFGFPKDEELLRKWCDNLQLDPGNVRNRRICEDHFEPAVMGTVKLMKGAVPTRNLGPDQPKPVHENTITPPSKLKFDVTKCVVPNCGRGGVGVALFAFPRTAKLLHKWCENVSLPTKNSKYYRICRRHFEPKALDGRRLRVGAKPTVHLGNVIAIKQHKIKEEKIPGQCCIVKTCQKTPEAHQVRLYAFPTNTQMQRKWCHNLKQSLEKATTEKRYVCSEHFVQQALVKQRLCSWALPTLKLGHKAKIIENPTQFLSLPENGKCCLEQHCKQTETAAKLYSFPKRGTLLRKWAHNTKQNAYTAQRSEFQLCAVHFEHCCFTADGELQENAVPTLYLGHKEAQIYAPLEDSIELDDTAMCCIVPNCGRTVIADGVQCFPFPTDMDELAKWCHNLQLDAEKCRNALICNMHFESSCISNQKLLPNMVPTLLLGHSNHTLQLHINREPSKRQFMLNDHNKCCVRDCGKSHHFDGVTLNRFPHTRSLYLMWTHNLKLTPGNRVLQVFKVCGDHFEEECKAKGNRLKPGAVPTLKLGHDDPNIYHNKQTYLNGPRKGLKRKRAALNLNCVVKGCNVANYLHMHLYTLPQDKELFREWCDYLNLNAAQTPYTTTRLCGLHFAETYKSLTEIKNKKGRKTTKKAVDHDELQKNYESIMSSTRIQLLKCCVAGCNTKFTDNIKLMQFPKSADQCAKWQHNTKIHFATQQRYLYKVCALHFESHCFGPARLRFWAVPTLRLPNAADIYHNPTEHAATAKCCVKNCPTNSELAVKETGDGEKDDNTTRLWSFPRDSAVLEKWYHNLSLSNDISRKRMKICSRHFEPYCIGKMLRIWAIPTLQLHAPPSQIHENPTTEVLYYTCCVATCRQMRDDDAGIKLYTFPNKESLFEKWAHNLRMDADTCRFARICTLHFEKQCLTPMMQPWALPTLDLGHNETDIFRNPKIKLNVYSEKCCLPHCGKVRHQHNVKLYSFPKEEAVLAKWWHNLRITRQEVRNRKICSTHFEPMCINLRGLKPWAVPTCNLGHNDDILPNLTVTEVIELEHTRNPQILDDAQEQKGAKTSPTLKCAIETCQRPNGKHRFPKQDWLRQKWCDNTRISIEDAAHAKICSKHFEPHVMGKSKPRPWALPTLELGQNEAIHANPKHLLRFHPEEYKSGEVKFVRGNHCAIITCMKSNQDGVKLFHYPKKGGLLRKWAENCKHYAYQAKRYNFAICSEHFEPDCYNNVRLRVGAVPTLKLGHDEKNIHRSELISNEAKSVKTSKNTKCSVPQCGRTKQHDNVRIFKFPANAEILQKWCYNLRMDVADAKDAVICNMHFEERCITRGRVLMRAIPTLLLGHTNIGDIYDNPVSFERPETVVRCCVTGCGKSKSDDVLLSAFPKTRSSFEKWAHNLKLPTTSEVWHTYKVCSEHFESYCHEHGRVKFGAIPTLKLGHNDPDIYQVTENDVTFTKKSKREHHSGTTKCERQLNCDYPDCNEINMRLVSKVFKIPKLPVIRQLWYEQLGIQSDADVKQPKANAPEPTLCPLHFKILYDENIEYLKKLERDANLSQAVQKLKERYAIVTDLSCVRKVTCSVPGCQTNSVTLPAILYQFPVNRELSEKWCHNTTIALDEDRRYCFKVCEIHFEVDCLYENSRRLKPTAVPTLNLPNPERRTIHQNVQRDLMLDRRSLLLQAAANKCCIKNCVHAKGNAEGPASETQIQFFNFPNETELLYKWLHNTGMSMVASSNARICSLHFEKHCINKRLRAYAVPTLLLGHDRTDIYTNPEDAGPPAKKKCELTRESNETTKTMELKVTTEMEATTEGAREVIRLNEIAATKEIVTKSAMPINEVDSYDRDTSRHCRIEDCVSHAKSADVKLYKFPRSHDQFQKWLHNTQMDVDKTRLWRYRICQRHFEPICLKFKKLPVGTMPTLNLGPQKPTKIYENEFNLANLKKMLKNAAENSLETSNCANESTDMDLTNDYDTWRTHTADLDLKEISFVQRTCCVPECKTNKFNSAGIRYFSFPDDKKLLSKWLFHLKIEYDTSHPNNYSVCERHFEPNYIQNDQLVAKAVPILNLSTACEDSEALDDLVIISDDENSSISTPAEDSDYNAVVPGARKCCLAHCQKRKFKDNVHIFKFPTVPGHLDRWLNNLRIKFDGRTPWLYSICSDHFEPRCIFFGGTQVGLYRWAVPTLNLGAKAPAVLFSNGSEKESDSKQAKKEENLESMKDLPIEDYATDNAVNNNTNLDALKTASISSDDEDSTSATAATANNTEKSADTKPNLRKCFLDHCRKCKLKDSVHMFKFPAAPDQLDKWCHNLGIKIDRQKPWMYSICSDHFEDRCITLYKNEVRLFRWAIPTENLGPKVPAILFTNKVKTSSVQNMNTLRAVPMHKQLNENQFDTNPKQNMNEWQNTTKIQKEKTLDVQPVSYNINIATPLSLSTQYQPTAKEHQLIPVNSPDLDLLQPISRPPRAINYEEDDDESDYEDNSLLDVVREENTNLEETSFYTTNLVRAGWSTKQRICCLPHCMRTRGSGLRLFRFPTDSITLQRWEHNLRTRFHEKQRNTHLICSDHFEPHLFNKRLVYGAIPTLNLGHDSTDIYRNGVLEEPGGALGGLKVHDKTPVWREMSANFSSTKQTALRKPRCNVPGCNRTKTTSPVRLYPFPNNKAIMKIWMERTKIAYDLNRHAELRVCDAHFEADCTDINGLRNNAVPTLFLPAPKLAEPASVSQQSMVAHSSIIRCSVLNCGNTTAMREIKMFSKFPEDFELFTKWCFNLKVDPRTYVEGTYNVCSAHFEHYCIGGHNLREWAVPTLQLGHASKLIHNVERPAEVELKCCLPHCGRKKSQDGVGFFNFPKGDLYKTWCQILKIDEGLYRDTSKRICSAHFTADSFNSVGGLKAGARPTQLLRNRTANASAHILKPPPYRSKCIVRTCHEIQQLYNFPETRSLCTKWCHNLKIDYYPKLHENANFKICRRHFDANCLVGGKLHPEAVPTAQLGHNDRHIFHNSVRSNTSSYDDNSSVRTSVSTVHTWLMDVEAETNVTEIGTEDAVASPAVKIGKVKGPNIHTEEESYYADFEEQQLLPHSTFVAADSNEIIDLDAEEVTQEIANWQGDADDDNDDDAELLWPLN